MNPAYYRSMSRYLPIAALLAPAWALAQDGLCPAWSDPQMTGSLDIAVLPEASGLEIRADGSQFYVMNDGTTPVFDVMQADGSGGRRVRVTGFRPLDLEDLAIGPCGAQSCLFLGDVGDNATRRENVQFALVAERKDYAAEVAPQRIVRARYPDGPRDAEAIAVDPDGDLWLVTKAPFRQTAPTEVFRLSAAQLARDGEQIFERVGEIPVATLANIASSARRVVTAMDIAPDGSRFVLLTYTMAFEFGFALADGLPRPAGWREGETHRAITTAPLIQAESIAYADGGRALVYTTESVQGSPSPLFRQTCR